jgi:hypothetical protein
VCAERERVIERSGEGNDGVRGRLDGIRNWLEVLDFIEIASKEVRPVGRPGRFFLGIRGIYPGAVDESEMRGIFQHLFQ